MQKAVAFAGGALALGLAVAAWAAGPTAQGAPFRLSACTTCRQTTPAVAGSSTGGFMAVWEGSSATDNRGINGRLFTNLGAPLVAEFLVNKNIAPEQYDAAVARDLQGNFLVVWSEVSAGNSEIMAQRITAGGAPLGLAFKVNQDAPGSRTIPTDVNPAVARMNDGGFIVTWINQLPSSATFPGTNPQVLARRINAVGQPVGTQVKVSTGLVAGDRPDVCVDTTGKPVVVWSSVDAFRPFEPSKMGVTIRRLTTTGAATEPEVVVAAPAATSIRPAIGCGKGSTFVVLWHSELSPAVERRDILAQRFSRLGRKVGPLFRVNGTAAGDQRDPSLSFDSQGNFVAVWRDEPTNGIRGRRFNGTTGAPLSTDFQVVTRIDGASAPSNPDITHLGTTTSFVVVWNEGSAGGIFGRRFTS